MRQAGPGARPTLTSGELHGPVIVTVIAVRMMQPAIHEIIHVIAMRDGFVPAIWAVLVRPASFRRTALGILGTDRNGVLVNMIFVHMVEVTVVKIVHMAIVQDRGVAAVWTVLMGVVEMMFFGASHDYLSADPNLSPPKPIIPGNDGITMSRIREGMRSPPKGSCIPNL
jgi:hypothetical protein